MSVICKNSRGWVLDHSDFIKNTYSSVVTESDEKSTSTSHSKSFCFRNSLFKILTPFIFDSAAVKAVPVDRLRKKRRRSETFGSSLEICTVKSALEELVPLAKQNGHLINSPCIEDFAKNNEEARECSTSFFSDICQEKLSKCNGGNVANSPVLASVQGQSYLIPENSKFFCCNVQELENNLPKNSKFDFIILDPPWWNKYVRRRKTKQKTAGYQMMYNEEVRALPVNSWLAPNALVAVWCTNCARHRQDVITQWFPSWGLHHVATWFWVKVTCSGEPVCQFSPPTGKQPYERILIGTSVHRQDSLPPDNQCLISVPSAIHSHKPPLSEVMKPFLSPEPQCLELFARYLLPHWTSAGDQVLTLQNLKLYTQIQDDGS